MIASLPALPKVSVITVVFNGEAHIEATILSVLEQNYPNLEYIVIDGGSTDGTVKLIKKYESKIAYWHSETDGGIYDAMNKGLTKATGSWVNLLNAGDTFHTSQIISDIFESKIDAATVIYGGVEIIYPDLSRLEFPGSPSKLWMGMQFSHQSTFIKTDYHKNNLYNVSNKIAADLEFFYRAYRAKEVFVATKKIIARVITGGVSESNRIRAISASCDAVCGSRFRPLIRLYFLWRMLDSIVRSIIKRSLPRSLVKRLILLK